MHTHTHAHTHTHTHTTHTFSPGHVAQQNWKGQRQLKQTIIPPDYIHQNYWYSGCGTAAW